MLCIRTNGNDIAPNVAENTIANANANRPIKKPNIANSIFIAITQIKPSISHVNINPGNFMDKVEHQINTSPTIEPESMQ